MKKVKDIYFDNDSLLPIYILDDGEVKIPVFKPFRHSLGKVAYLSKEDIAKYKGISDMCANDIIMKTQELKLKVGNNGKS